MAASNTAVCIAVTSDVKIEKDKMRMCALGYALIVTVVVGIWIGIGTEGGEIEEELETSRVRVSA